MSSATLRRSTSASAVLRPRARPALRGALATVLLASWLAAPAAAQTTRGGFQEVAVSLQSQSFDSELPFDVPFLVRGTVDKEVVQVALRYREWCKQPSRWWRGGGCRLTERNAPFVSPAPRPWTPLVRSTAAEDTFRILVPALDVNRFYEFRFETTRLIAADRMQQVRERAAVAISDVLSGFSDGTVDSARAGTLRRRLVREVRALTAGDTIVAPGSLFAPDYRHDEFTRDFNSFWIAVLDPQGRIRTGRSEYAAAGDSLGLTLEATAASEPLQRLLRALREAAEADVNVRRLLDANDAAVATLSLGPQARLRLARGQDPAGASELQLATATDSAEAAQFALRHDTTAAELARARAWLRTLVDPQGANRAVVAALVRAGALAAEDADSVRALAGTGGSLRAGERVASRAARNARMVARNLADRRRAVSAFAARVELHAVGIRLVQATTVGTYDTFRSRYVSVEPGTLYAPGLPLAVPYSGVNVYLIPVNKHAPLSLRGGFRRRFAPTVGFTLRSVADDARGRSDFLAGTAAMLGAGFRVTQSIRVGGGWLVFMRDDPDPTRTSKDVAGSPYASLAVDVDIKNFPETVQSWLSGR